MIQGKWQPADGAEQTDTSLQAAQERVGTGFWTAEEKSAEAEEGFDAAYTTWRTDNGDQHDSDYRRWRRETGESFSPAFLAWVSSQR